MPYYPKSQIKTDLFTKGEEFRVKTTKKEYIGYYWKTSKGEFFSGKNPSFPSPLTLEKIPLLSPLQTSTLAISKGNTSYNNLKKVDTSTSLLLPYYVKPSPTKKDYELGSFTRFFAKKFNENLYIETSQNIYNKLKNRNSSYAYKLYLIFTLNWRLTGSTIEVTNTNKNLILLTEQTLNITGLNIYLKYNYTEFILK